MNRFDVVDHPRPTPPERITELLSDPGFGKYFTDHTAVVDWRDIEGWAHARVEPYGPIMLDPSASVLHYASEIFEGVKAYRHTDGHVYTFRPDRNAARMNTSAVRMSLPELDEELFIESLEALVVKDEAWVPSGSDRALYLRPFMFATEASLGVRPPSEVTYRVIASPVAGVFGPASKPTRIWVSREYTRAAPGGTGAAKTGGNYAGSVAALTQARAHGCAQVLFLDPVHGYVEEIGAMNIFFVTDDGVLVTPDLTGSILPGVTRDSLMRLWADRGLAVEERRITLQEVADGAADGTITEAFACGTAAVVAPIGELVDGDTTITLKGDHTSTLSLRNELVGIQTGKVRDRHGWLRRLT